MTSFTAGQTLTLSLDFDDTVSFNGQGVATITPTSGSVFTTYLTGQQTLGPYKQYVTVSIVTSTSGSYSVYSQTAVDPVATLSTDSNGNVTGLVGPGGAAVPLSTSKQVTYQLTGNGSFTPPAWASALLVSMVGGGGGGAGSGTTPGAGTSGGSTQFGQIIANGGSGGFAPTGYANGGGAGGASIHGDINLPGQAGGNGIPGVTYGAGGKGGDTQFGRNIASVGSSPSVAPPANSGCGGNGAASNATATTGGGGGSGAYVQKYIYPAFGSYAYYCGTGGSAGATGTGGNAGAAGANGSIYVTCLALNQLNYTKIGIYPYYATGSDHLTAFKSWLGRGVDEVIVFINNTSFANMRADALAATQNPVVLNNKPAWTLALTVTGTTLAQIAAGSNDADWNYIASCMVQAQPTGEIRVRLGWESNGTWYPWTSNGIESQYISAFQHVVTLFRAISSRFAFEWAPDYTVYVNSVLINSELAYPGDAYVDVIGLSVYYDIGVDNANPLYAFGDKRDSAYGLAWQVNFAKLHQKRYILSEWGVNSDGKQLYVQAMSQWLKAQQYEQHNYWDSNLSISCALSAGQWPATGAQFITEFSKY